MGQQRRALCLRSLVLGHEYGRVFPAGVRPGSPSRGAANIIYTPGIYILYNCLVFAIQSVGCDVAVVWLVDDVVPEVRASSELQFGALREVLMLARERQEAWRPW